MPFLLLVCPFFSSAEGSLVISQVQIEGDGGANDEFVEIYNPTDVCVGLSGWSLQYKSSSGSFPLTSKKALPNIELPAKAKYLVARSEYNSAITADLIHSSFSLSGSAGGAGVFLSSSSQGVSGLDDASIIDSFVYGNTASNTPLVPGAAEKPAADWAYVRTNFSGNYISDFSVQASSPQNFAGFTGSLCGAATTTPDNTATTTPDTEVSSSTPKNLDIKIYRFLPDPYGDDAGNEWVELRNNGLQDAVLDGWLLDDKNTGSGPAADAYVLSGQILAGEIRRFIIPPAHLALNNTGGDEVNLYFSDKTLADTAVYSVSAYGDGIFEFVNNAWQPPIQNTATSGGSSGGSSQAATFFGSVNVRINEVLPNPSGDDTGSEWVEIYNPETSTTSLEGFFLGAGESAVWYSGAYEVPKISIPPKELAQIVIPKSSISLKNTGKEKVLLFSPVKQLVDFVEYSDAPENRSWQKSQSQIWEWNLPSPGTVNIIPDIAKIIFSEILPLPNADQDEFVELYNFATTTVNLKEFSLSVGTRVKTFSDTDVLPPESYLILSDDDLPVNLRNSGQEITLRDNWDRLVAQVTYPAAQKGQSFASLDGKEFLWTASITPGAANQMVLGESVKAEIKSVAAASPQVKKITAKSVPAVQTSSVVALTKENANLNIQLAALQEKVDELSRKVDSLPEENPVSSQELFWWESGKYLVLALACGVFLFWLLKFLSQNSGSKE